MGWQDYPRAVKLIAGMQARPEFQTNILSHTKAHHIFLERLSQTPAGEKVSFWLPMEYQ
jgi:hypothetical protein